MTTCTECYGEPDLYYGCDDCGRPPRRHLIPAAELAKLDALEARHGTEEGDESMDTPTDWYIRDDKGRIIGPIDACAYPGCPDKHEPGGVHCPKHAAEASAHWAADRYGWGCSA